MNSAPAITLAEYWIYIEENPARDKREPWLQMLPVAENNSHRLYKGAMAMATDLTARQMCQQLRDEKMRSITTLRQYLHKEK
ncbi:hypothetical protein [Desulfofalx alkaliphila]|uniref:hypothetical protein n=1 Tax=Desulfofalx alkaliphila TaxID=105483 RepID=UPI0004E2410B|nr:hypothetical protein [Desulfofalx alkaliphila]